MFIKGTYVERLVDSIHLMVSFPPTQKNTHTHTHTQSHQQL